MELKTKFWSADMDCAVRSQVISGVNGLDMHVLESGYENPENPTISVSYTHLTLPTTPYV